MSLSGGNRVISIMIQQLQQKGHEIFVVSQPPYRWPIRRKIKMVFLGKGWPKTEKLAPFFKIGGVTHSVLDVQRPVVAEDIPDADVVIATFWTTAYWVMNLPESKGVKCYFVQGYEIEPYFYNSKADQTYRLPLHKIVVSGWLKNIMEKTYGDYDCDLVPNAVDLEHFKSNLRRKNDRLTVGFMYSLAPTKTTRLAIEAVEKAKSSLPNLKVIAFGSDKPERPLDLPKWVEFHYRPDQDLIPQLYASCDVWLYTSEWEGFGLPILEAMSCRTPLIAVPTGAAPDLITPENGVMVKPEVDAFVQEILNFDKMPDETWVEMSNKAHAAASAYTWDDAADLFEAALEEAVKKGNKA
jgi:glycosyltransferase involved in cell wall biosynthesis